MELSEGVLRRRECEDGYDEEETADVDYEHLKSICRRQPEEIQFEEIR